MIKKEIEILSNLRFTTNIGTSSSPSPLPLHSSSAIALDSTVLNRSRLQEY
nr:6788_t:CDS:2 [Entrophospora candida]